MKIKFSMETEKVKIYNTNTLKFMGLRYKKEKTE
jgi:hypothetical protein